MRLRTLVTVHCIYDPAVHDPAVPCDIDKYLLALLMTGCYAVWAGKSREIDYDHAQNLRADTLP